MKPTEQEQQILFQAMQTLCPSLQTQDFLALAPSLSALDLKKKAFFIRAGQKQTALGFILKGLFRAFFLDENAKEHNLRFYAQNDYLTHYTALLDNKPSLYDFQALEPSRIILLPAQSLEKLYLEKPRFERYGRLIAEQILKVQQNRIESFIFQNAELRYLDFIKNYPDLYARISLSQLCSYLGIERQTLTRIRQKLAKS